MLTRVPRVALSRATSAVSAAVLSVPSRSFGVRDPYAELDTTEADQDKIKSFLSSIKLAEHADKFKSWEHLVVSPSHTLKHHMQMNVRDRKKLRRNVHNWRLTQFYATGNPYVPAGPDGLGLRSKFENANDAKLSSSEEEINVLLPMETQIGFFTASKHYPGTRARKGTTIVIDNSPAAAAADADAAAAEGAEAEVDSLMTGVLPDNSNKASSSSVAGALAGGAGLLGGDAFGSRARQTKLEAAKAEANAAAGLGDNGPAVPGSAALDALELHRKLVGRAGRVVA